MGVYFKFVDYNRLINTLNNPPIIINDIEVTSTKDKKQLNKDIVTKYTESDILSSVPQCGCGSLKNAFNLGIICNICGEPVKELFEEVVEPKLWFRKPIGITALVNPQYWCMLKTTFSVKKFCFIEYLTNREYKEAPTEDIKNNLNRLHSLGIERGYNYFISNMEKILVALYSLPKFKTKKNNSVRGALLDLYDQFKHILLTDYLPILNKTLLIVESSENKRTIIDPTIHGVIDAIETMKGIDSPSNGYSISKKENRVSKIISILSDFYHEAHDKILAKKGGLFRKHCLGTRCHFSTRGVITSLTDPHKYDEIHIPWSFACVMLKLHIANKLFKMEYSPNEIVEFIDYHTYKYHPLLDQIFNELINESIFGGIPVFFVRNPSLTSSSVQLLKIAKIKTNIEDRTISIPILNVKAYNADYASKYLNTCLVFFISNDK